MELKNTRSIEVPLNGDNFETINLYIKDWMSQRRFSQKTIMEIMLLVEALFNQLIEQGYDSGTILTIKAKKRFGESSIKIGFEGEAYVPDEESQDDFSPEYRLVQAYNDKISYRYRLGYNSIRIIVKRNYRQSLMYCAIGTLLAILAYFPISSYMSVEQQVALDNDFIYPMMKLFGNAMLMVGTPVTLFSLIKNLTDIYIVSEKNSSSRKLQMKTIVTSIISIILAFGTGLFIAVFINLGGGYLGTKSSFTGGMSFSEFISSIIPSSIFEPFDTYMPFPIIIVALLITYAMCSIGKYFDDIQKIINVCYSLFSRMLNVIMFTLPFFCFLSILTALLPNGFNNLIIIAEFVVIVLVSLVVMIAFYLIRLLIGGVSPIRFIKHLPPLIWENFKINSAINAVPFNIRYCVKKYKFNRIRLSAKLPILAETNLDGNCYLIMLISMIFIFVLGVNVSWVHILGIAILILFLSLGAPNQPGSIVIGMLIITYFLQADGLISIAIYAEVFFGAIQNIINVSGDIVTVAIEENKEALKKAEKPAKV
jgi:Na+/H+-dicarboxylate symporter